MFYPERMTRTAIIAAPRNTHIAIQVLTPDALERASADIQNAARLTGFKARPGEIRMSGKNADSIILAGQPLDTSCFDWSSIAEGVQKSFGAEALKDISFSLHYHEAGHKVSLQAALGWGLGNFNHVTYKTDDEEFEPAALVVEDMALRDKAEAMLTGIILTRDLIHIPANSLSPDDLAGVAEDLGKLHKAKVKITRDKDLLKENLPMTYAVGESSHRRPCFVDLRWGDKTHPKLTLVGKGITFDTGGLNIKPAEAMKRMKKDMGGAAHALGLAAMIMAMRLSVQLRVLLPCAENAISSHAFRQQDVFTARNGKTIEIGHTDAEGRLVLSDALVAACEEEPDLLIDFATLTGAARVALGYEVPALFAASQDTGRAIQDLSMQVDDPVWMLPLWHGYRPEMASHIADINSIGSGRAGAIYGALFLNEFVTKGTDWVHLDVYAWSNDNKPGRARGGCDYGLRATMAYIENWVADHAKSG